MNLFDLLCFKQVVLSLKYIWFNKKKTIENDNYWKTTLNITCLKNIQTKYQHSYDL